MTSLDAVTGKARETAMARAAIVSGWNASGDDADVYAAHYNAAPTTSIERISRASLYRWRRALDADGIAGLVPGYHPSRGAGSRKLTDTMKQTLESLYLQPSRPSIAKCIRDAERVLNTEISERAGRDYLQSLPHSLVVRHRDGETRFRERCLPYLDRRFEDLEAMEKVTADHHKLDFLVIDQGRIFRPQLTMFSDIATRKPLAWMMTEQPDELVISSTFRAMLDDYGLPKEIVIDNGKDFKGSLLNGTTATMWQGVFGALGVTVTFVQPYHGQSKPVERWFRTVSEEFSKMMPTYVGSNTVSRHEDTQLYYRAIRHRAKKEVDFTMEEASERIDQMIRHWSATWKHEGRGMDGRTPDQAFKDKWVTRRTYNPDYDHLVFSREFRRVVRQRGITIDGTEYWADELHLELSRTVRVIRPIWDLQHIHVYGDDGRYICTASRADWEQTGDTEADLKRLKRTHRAVREQLKRIAIPAHIKEMAVRAAREAAQETTRPTEFHPAQQEVVNFDHLPEPPRKEGEENVLYMNKKTSRTPRESNRKKLFCLDE